MSGPCPPSALPLQRRGHAVRRSSASTSAARPLTRRLECVVNSALARRAAHVGFEETSTRRSTRSCSALRPSTRDLARRRRARPRAPGRLRRFTVARALPGAQAGAVSASRRGDYTSTARRSSEHGSGPRRRRRRAGLTACPCGRSSCRPSASLSRTLPRGDQRIFARSRRDAQTSAAWDAEDRLPETHRRFDAMTLLGIVRNRCRARYELMKPRTRRPWSRRRTGAALREDAWREMIPASSAPPVLTDESLDLRAPGEPRTISPAQLVAERSAAGRIRDELRTGAPARHT